MSSTQVHKASAADIRLFTRDARRIERLLGKRGGSLLDPKLALAKLGELVVASRGIVAPEGGRLHVANVPVNYDLPWNDAISAAGPQTGADWDIRKVGDLYLPKQRGMVTRRLVLVSFGCDTKSQANLAWGAQYKLPPADPQSVFAFASANKEFHKTLDMPSGAAIVSLVKCFFEGGGLVPRAWSLDTSRFADLYRVAGSWPGHYWFAFFCE